MPKTKEEVLVIYAQEGAAAAARAADRSIRTVQRWANEAGVVSGYSKPFTAGPDSAAAYLRGCRTPECVEAYREANRAAKERRIERFHSGETTPECGTASTYSNYDCRGEACSEAWSLYLRSKRAGIPVDSSLQVLATDEGEVLHCPYGLNPKE
jgi:hypothetical protein